MTTVVNNPAPQENSGNGMGMIIGAIVLLIVVVLFFVYGLPAMRSAVPQAPQVNIPSEIDVNVSDPSQE